MSIHNNVTRDTLDSLVEFDCVFQVLPDGSVFERPALYGPEVYDSTVTAGWTLVDGYSGQYGYSGPIMHASEYLGGRMAQDTLDTPGVYCLVVAYGVDESEDGPEPDGWCLARLV
jgi:hypothetical protein